MSTLHKRILVIDDDEPIREFLRYVFEKEGLVVDDARDGAEGLEFINNNTYDTVITDISMPKKDGVEIIIALRESGAATRIIAMSGVASKDKLLQIADMYGADAIISKPFTSDQILPLI